MTKEEAGEQLKSLLLLRFRLQKEIDQIRQQFCWKGDHHFGRLWGTVDNKSFRVMGFVCVLCGAENIVTRDIKTCPACSVDFEVAGVAPCGYCDFNSQDTVGVGIEKVPYGDVMRFSTKN